MATAANWDLRQLSWLVKLDKWGCNSHLLPSKAISTAIPDPGILASTTAPIICYSCWHHLATLQGHHWDSYSCCYSQLPQLLLPSLVPQHIAFKWFLLPTPPHYTTLPLVYYYHVTHISSMPLFLTVMIPAPVWQYDQYINYPTITIPSN